MSSVIKLETSEEEVASYHLANLIQKAIDTDDQRLVIYIRRLWDNESWDSIQCKFRTEGSAWYVWWMDGVREYIRWS